LHEFRGHIVGRLERVSIAFIARRYLAYSDVGARETGLSKGFRQTEITEFHGVMLVEKYYEKVRIYHRLNFNKTHHYLASGPDAESALSANFPPSRNSLHLSLSRSTSGHENEDGGSGAKRAIFGGSNAKSCLLVLGGSVWLLA